MSQDGPLVVDVASVIQGCRRKPTNKSKRLDGGRNSWHRWGDAEGNPPTSQDGLLVVEMARVVWGR